VQVQELVGGGVVVETGSGPTAGRAELHVEGRVVRVIYAGRLVAELLPPIREGVARAAAAAGRVHLFVDATAVQSYTTEYRQAVTAWIGAIKGTQLTGNVTMLFRSRLVAMGVSLFNLVLPSTIEPVSTRDELERRIAAAKR
jgi:hypothetical protein